MSNSKQWAVYRDNRNAVNPAWFESELRASYPAGFVIDEKKFQDFLSEFRSRISGGFVRVDDNHYIEYRALEPWRQDAEMKLMLESVRESFESRSDDYGRLSYGADTSWRTEARDKLNEVDAALFDDLLEQEERERAKDVERRAKCAAIGRQLGLAN